MSAALLRRFEARTGGRTRVRLRGARSCLPALAVGLVVSVGCSPAPTHKRLAMVPIGTTPPVNDPPAEPEAEAPGAPPPTIPASPSGPCTGTDVDALDVALKGCEVPMPRAGDLPATKDKLDIALVATKPSVAPGARVELVLTLRNKSDAALPLFFSGDPIPRFDVEALDASGKRQGRPAGKPPPSKSDKAKDAKASRFTLAPGGVARVHLAWDAVKLRWAPERQKTWEGHGPPTAPAGPLPRGKYTLRVVVPLLGVFERGDVELPKVAIDVG